MVLAADRVCPCRLLSPKQKRCRTSDLSKAHVTRDSSGPATLAISVQHAIKKMRREKVLEFETSVRKTS